MRKFEFVHSFFRNIVFEVPTGGCFMRVLRFSREAASLFVVLIFCGSAFAQEHTLLGTNCAAPPIWHCPDRDCASAVITQPGNTVETKTRRTFFLDCPSDYKPGDKVTVVLSLHGFGSYANW